MRIFRCRLVPKHYCVNLFGTIWVRDSSWIDMYVVNHERIHTAQQRELLFIFFYIFYVVEYLVRLVIYRSHHKAYMNISFEREAYSYGHELSYLSRRRNFAWIKHINLKWKK